MKKKRKKESRKRNEVWTCLIVDYIFLISGRVFKINDEAIHTHVTFIYDRSDLRCCPSTIQFNPELPGAPNRIHPSSERLSKQKK
jgi:hypothetical protein